MTEINPTDIRYIKLGPGGAWVPHCVETGEIQFGYVGEPFEQAQCRDWDGVVAHYVSKGRNLAKARDAMREVQDFFTLGADCLWVTFADQHLWWAFAEPGVDVSPAPMAGQAVCRRQTIGGWRKTNVCGEALRIDALSSRLTQVAAYRQTICSVKASDYLLRRINAVPEPIVLAATQARGASVVAARAMIEQLHWSDFEILIDLIFARGGWQRTTRLGETMADVDLLLEQTTLGETASVQIKSRASQSVLDAHIEMHRKSGRHHRTFFVCHTADTAMSAGEHRDVHLWTGEFLAEIAVRSGLFDWLMERTG